MARNAALLVLAAISISSDLSAEDIFFDSDGVRIRYQVEGDGPPVVLIHGYMASGDLNWRIPGVIRALSPHYQVITIDNRGHGRSDKPDKVEAYGVNMVMDVIRLLDHLKIEKAHLVGYSMGGMITLKLVAMHPERVSSGVIGGMGWTEKRANTPTQDRRFTLPRPRSPALVACAKAFPELGISEEELKGIATPLTVVIGSADGLYERRVKPLEAARPDIPVVLIPEATHINCMFKPAFTEAISAFLRKHAG